MKRLSNSVSGRIGRRRYKFSIHKRFLTMPDGVQLAASLYIPITKNKNETFPALLEYLPYRKDDTFYVMDHECFSYFAELGFIAVKVDIRGTGASHGFVPEREYSDIEMSDCHSIIEHLAHMPGSNGNVGMFGISWSGFNAVQMAMQRPAALKAIHAVHASDDLYHDDLHYIDGNLHLDPYHLFINHELGLPRTPDYKLDQDYFEQRFNQRPWLFTYLNNQLDGPFWRGKSLREDFGQIDIPVFLTGGLLDGYRTAEVRMFKNLKVPVRCDIGPWDHSCPDGGSPGPNFEWQMRLGQWFMRYLRQPASNSRPTKNAAANAADKEFMVYVRHGHAPDAEIETVPGYWRKDSLPARGTRNVRFALAASRQLIRSRPSSSEFSPVSADELVYHPFAGTSCGAWWGNKTGDVAGDDALSLTYDTAALTRPMQIIGQPCLKVNVKSTSSKAKWTVRLEDVAPDGKVMLITGGLLNPSQTVGCASRLAPRWPDADTVYEIDVPLHFTTWTFQPGHKVRLAIANAQFPMAWPSPEVMVSTVFSGGDSTELGLTLPVVPFNAGAKPHLPRLVDKIPCPDGAWIQFPGKPEAATFNRVDKKSGALSHTVLGNSAYRVRKRRFFCETKNTWTTFDKEPWRSSYLGVAQTTIVSQGKKQRLRTRIFVVSDETNFYVTVNRTIFQNGKVVRRRRFTETIARCFQ